MGAAIRLAIQLGGGRPMRAAPRRAVPNAHLASLKPYLGRLSPPMIHRPSRRKFGNSFAPPVTP